MRSSIYFIMEERRSWGSKENMNLMVWVLWEVVSECEFVMIHLPFLQAVCSFASIRDDEKFHFVRFSSES